MVFREVLGCPTQAHCPVPPLHFTPGIPVQCSSAVPAVAQAGSAVVWFVSPEGTSCKPLQCPHGANSAGSQSLQAVGKWLPPPRF